MSKMRNAMMLVFGIEISIFLFAKAGYNSTSMFDFIVNLMQWNFSSFLETLFSGIALFSVGAIIVGTFVTNHDWIWRASMVSATFFGFGAVIAQLWAFLNAHVGSLTSISPEAAQYIAGIIIVPFIFYFLFASLDFISGKD